jgi:hypothetical protein
MHSSDAQSNPERDQGEGKGQGRWRDGMVPVEDQLPVSITTPANCRMQSTIIW